MSGELANPSVFLKPPHHSDCLKYFSWPSLPIYNVLLNLVGTSCRFHSTVDIGPPFADECPKGKILAIYRLDKVSPVIHESTLVADSAIIIGSVTIAENASVWFVASIRADNEPITIGADGNVQENAVLHTDPGFPMIIEQGVTIGHQAMLHGCTVKEGALIGIQAVVLNGAVIGRHCRVGAGAVVTEGNVFPDSSLIIGAPAKVVRELTAEQIAGLKRAAQGYIDRRERYKTGLVRIG